MATTFRSRKLILATATVAALAALAGGAAVFQANASQRAKQGQVPQAMPVSVAEVVLSDVSTWDEFSVRL